MIDPNTPFGTDSEAPSTSQWNTVKDVPFKGEEAQERQNVPISEKDKPMIMKPAKELPGYIYASMGYDDKSEAYSDIAEYHKNIPGVTTVYNEQTKKWYIVEPGK